LEPHGYREVTHTPGLWKHKTRPVQFFLVVDDFGVKYVGRENAEHLIQSLQQHYKLVVDEKGALYCGIKLDWDYEKRTLDIGMPGYVKKILQRFQHAVPSRQQYSPYCAPTCKHNAAAQDPLPEDTSGKINKKRVHIIQQVIGGVLY